MLKMYNLLTKHLIAMICNYIISNSTFDSNIATIQGGAIMYNKYRPNFTIPNYFSPLNYAPYGSNLAGYPYSIRLINMEIY